MGGGVFYTGLNQLVCYGVHPVWEAKPESLPDMLLGMVINFSSLIWSFIAWCAVVLALSYDDEAREQSLRLVEAQALAAESQNQMLRYQINPHFLFNTLNALSSLILQKDFDRAERMVLSLSNFLRASLEKAPGDKITLADELTAQRQYLAIEQERFGDRLRLTEKTPAGPAAALVPGLILQPLIENAVKYGVARTTRPVAVEIIARATGDRLTITVGTTPRPTSPMRPPPWASALPTCAAVLRCSTARRPAHRRPRPGGGFSAVIEFPLERRP